MYVQVLSHFFVIPACTDSGRVILFTPLHGVHTCAQCV